MDIQAATNPARGTILGPHSLPFLGNLPQLLPDPMPFVTRLHERFGNVFYASFALNRKSVFLLGPEASERVLVSDADSFSNALGYDGQSQFIGSGAVLFRDGAAHRATRQAMNPAFRASALDGYLEKFHSHIPRHLNVWSTHPSSLDLASEVRMLALRIAADTIAGAQLESEASLLNRHFIAMLDAMVGLLPALPGTAKWRGLRGRTQLRAYFEDQIDRRRHQEGSDLFSNLIRQAEAGQMSGEALVDNMLGLLVASYETTATTMAMTMYQLAAHPEWQSRLREAHSGKAPSGLDRADLESQAESEWVLKETLRLYPPLSWIPRRSIRELQIEGHVLPANTPVTVSPAFTQRQASIYASPDRFDPLRFSPERAEDRTHPCAWMPFGKGAHACMGMHFARLEVKAFLAHLLPRFRIVLTGPQKPQLRHVPVLRPSAPLPIALEALN